MDSEKTLDSLNARFAAAAGPDRQLEQDICEAYVVTLAELVSVAKVLTKLSLLSTRATFEGVGTGDTLVVTTNLPILQGLVGSIEAIAREVSERYTAEYQQR